MKLILSFLLFILMTVTAYADEPHLGWSGFPCMSRKYPYKLHLKIYEGIKKPGLPVLWGTFGNSRECIKEFASLTADRHSLLEIHFSNENCRKRGRCLGGELMGHLSTDEYNKAIERRKPKVRREVKRRIIKISQFVEKLNAPHMRFVLSLGLEDLYTTRAARQLHRWLRKDWRYEIGRNPMRVGDPLVGSFLELHGDYPPVENNCVYNTDGLEVQLRENSQYRPSISVSRFKEAAKNYCGCKAIFGWTSRWQGLEGAFVAPRDRRYGISKRDVRRVNNILKSIQRACS